MITPFAEAIRSLFNADSTYAAAVPGEISPEQIAQSNNTRPAAVYSNLTDEGFSSLDGPEDGLGNCSMDFQVVCNTVAQVKAAEAAIKAIIRTNRVRKVVGSNTLYALQYGPSTMAIQDITDGNDEPFYILTIPISGWVT